MKEYEIPLKIVQSVKQNTPSVGKILWEIIDSNCAKEECRTKGFIKTHDAKCCEFMQAGGMFYCGEIMTCPYYNKVIKPMIDKYERDRDRK